MPTLSIIVPVYNVEAYLPQCIDSLRAQTYRDIEIICVNDGATDRSEAILQRYARVEPRMVIVNKENGGLSSARNAGIARAKGTYVCFVDSDDLLAKNAAQRIVCAFEETDAAVVTYGGRCYPEFATFPWLEEALSPRDVLYEGFRPSLLFEENSHPFAWRTACRRDFLVDNALYFNENLRFGEDQLFHFAIYPRSPRTALISDRLYYYRAAREGSLMASRGNDKGLRLYDHLRIVEAICADWQRGGFIDQYVHELFTWINEFVMGDLLLAAPWDRAALMNFYDAVVRTCFTPAQIEDCCAVSRYGDLARDVLFDRAKMSGFKRRCMVASFVRRSEGRKALCRLIANRVGDLRPFRCVRDAWKSVFAASSRHTREYAERLVWETQEAQRASASLRLLDVEIAAQEQVCLQTTEAPCRTAAI
jgi:glycosyltransferase involved in cell wall biosynthesis